jgi:hypothetical protein
MGVPNGGPKWGSKSGSHITLCLEMSKYQNDKMAEWPNDQMAKWRDRRSECAQSDSKAYGTTCCRQKVKSELSYIDGKWASGTCVVNENRFYSQLTKI